MRYLNTLLKLKELGELNFSQVPKILLKQLQDEFLIEVKTISGKKKKVIAKKQFYKAYKDIENIKTSQTRAELIKANSHTKAKKISPQDGLYINGNCKIEDINLPIFENSALFLKEIPYISKDILIICLENFENLIYFKSQTKYFQEDNILFVFRNSMMLKLLERLDSLENKIIYFADFDLAGIFIYETQILPRCKKVEFYIPKDIENLIEEYGSKDLYSKQYDKYRNFKSENIDIKNLINIINKNQKVLEQEYFI